MFINRDVLPREPSVLSSILVVMLSCNKSTLVYKMDDSCDTIMDKAHKRYQKTIKTTKTTEATINNSNLKSNLQQL